MITPRFVPLERDRMGWLFVASVVTFSIVGVLIGYSAGSSELPQAKTVVSTTTVTVSLLKESDDCKKSGGTFDLEKEDGVMGYYDEASQMVRQKVLGPPSVHITCDVTTLDKTINL